MRNLLPSGEREAIVWGVLVLLCLVVLALVNGVNLVKRSGKPERHCEFTTKDGWTCRPSP